MSHYRLQDIRLDTIVFNPRQPRSDGETADLEALAASFGAADTPLVAQLPVVHPAPQGGWMVQAGERRVRAATMHGIVAMQMLVLDTHIAPEMRHRLRVLENLHRVELNPLDEAIALKVVYYVANAHAMGVSDQANTILETADDSLAVLDGLHELLLAHQWVRTRPQVDWEACLAPLGLTLHRSTVMRRIQVLNLDPQVLKRLRDRMLSAASIKALGKLTDTDQVILIDALEETPDIEPKIRRICSKVADTTYSIREAIAEARGVVYFEEEDSRSLSATSATPAPSDDGSDGDDPDVMDGPDAAAPSKKAGAHADSAHADAAHTDEEEVDFDVDVDVGGYVMDAVSLMSQLTETLQQLQQRLHAMPLMEPWGELFRDTYRGLHLDAQPLLAEENEP